MWWTTSNQIVVTCRKRTARSNASFAVHRYPSSLIRLISLKKAFRETRKSFWMGKPRRLSNLHSEWADKGAEIRATGKNREEGGTPIFLGASQITIHIKTKSFCNLTSLWKSDTMVKVQKRDVAWEPNPRAHEHETAHLSLRHPVTTLASCAAVVNSL